MATSSFDLTAALWQVKQATGSINYPTAGHADLSEGAMTDATTLRMQALAAMGEVIEQNQDDILEANTLDLEISRDMAVPDLVVDWLKLTPERVRKVVSIFKRLSLTGTAYSTSRLIGDTAQQRVCPVGTVGFIYEAFPDVGAIAAALCICTGNALVLRGGGEAIRTNRIIVDLLRDTLDNIGLPPALLCLIESTEVSRQDIAQCPSIDLIIAHGRPSLVDQVVKQASVPVIPSRMGNCYLYWSASGSLDKVYQMIVDSHSGSPDAVNRIEKILVHDAHSPNSVIRLLNRLQENGFEVVADAAISSLYSSYSSPTKGAAEASESEWDYAYLRRKVALRRVENCEAAVQWINYHSRGHADSIVTADYVESRLFTSSCRSASIYINASPKFVRDAKQAQAIALGVSNYKGIAGGLINMDAMQVRQRIYHGS